MLQAETFAKISGSLKRSSEEPKGFTKVLDEIKTLICNDNLLYADFVRLLWRAASVVQTFLHHLRGTQYGAGFVLGFLPFGFVL